MQNGIQWCGLIPFKAPNLTYFYLNTQVIEMLLNVFITGKNLCWGNCYIFFSFIGCKKVFSWFSNSLVFYFIMTKRVCCVKECANSGYQFKKKQYCDEYKTKFIIICNLELILVPVNYLFPFPTEQKDNAARLIWIKMCIGKILMVQTGHQMWTQGYVHFVDNYPSTKKSPPCFAHWTFEH